MAIFHELDLVKFSELFSVNFDELRQCICRIAADQLKAKGSMPGPSALLLTATKRLELYS